MTFGKLSPNRLLILLILFAVVFLLTGLGSNQLIDWDENIYAEASRQMMVRGDYLNVMINGVNFAEKPPLFFWEQILSFKLFGINEFAARLPSAIAGILMMGLCFFVGSRIHSPQLGLIWGIVFLTALIPSSLARASAIDHTFNLFIAAAVFSLYLFDQRFALYLHNEARGLSPSRKKHLAYLTIGSVCLGLAFLTKSPLGSVIALAAFTGYKVMNWQPAIRIKHFLFCAILSLAIALSWYTVNWLVYGGNFIADFIQFQLRVFSEPMQGHEGPVYYHFVIGLLGMLPWTAFLFVLKARPLMDTNPKFRHVFYLAVSWIGFVLIITSLVSTKLPHYSASIYIPLSLLIAYVLVEKINSKQRLPKWSIGLFVALGLIMSVGTMMVPRFADQFLTDKKITFTFHWPTALYFAGSLMIGLSLVASFLFLRNKIKAGIVITAVLMLVFTQNLWQNLMPPFLSYNQQPLLEMVDDAYQKGNKVVFYRFVSFAALFYGKKPIDMLYTDKFNADPKILAQRHNKDLEIVSDISNKKRLLKEYPLVEHVRDKGTFSLFIIRRQ